MATGLEWTFATDEAFFYSVNFRIEIIAPATQPKPLWRRLLDWCKPQPLPKEEAR